MRHHTNHGQRGGFTLIELLVVVAVLAILISVLLPALSSVRVAAQRTQNNVNLRSVHTAMLAFGDTNDGLFTGINGSAREWKALWRGYDLITIDTMGTMPEVRFSELLTEDLIEPEALIHPAELDEREVWRGQVTADPETETDPNLFDYRYYSYALNELGWDKDPAYEQAQKEWSVYGSQRTPVVSDRLYDIAGGLAFQWDATKYIGMFSNRPGDFEIGIAWNDGHVDTSETAVIGNTKIGRVTNSADNIFSRGADGQEGNVQQGSPVDATRGSSVKMNTDQWEPIAPKF